MRKDMRKVGKNTSCIHAKEELNISFKGATTPIFTDTSYKFTESGSEVYYPRHFNTPNQSIVAAKIAALENGEEGLVLSSGMAAISTILFTFLKPGDHAIFQRCLYGGTSKFINSDLRKFDIEITLINSTNIDEYKIAIKKNTKIIYVESPSNPLLQVIDLEMIGRLGKENGILTIVDNTFATPINQNPLDYDFDIVLHSGTKYLNGHSDLICGAIVTSKELMVSIIDCAKNLGGTLDAHACHMLERGLKTLGLRVKQQNNNALKLAQFLSEHPFVNKVFYPGLLAYPGYSTAKKQMTGFGGMLSFELKGKYSDNSKFLNMFNIAFPGVSLGGIETLLCFPADTTHKGMSKKEREEVGINENLVRVSVGIEDIEDLIEDFKQALESLKEKVNV